MDVERELAALRMEFSWLSAFRSLDWYSLGSAVMKSGGAVAVMTDVTMELMLPVMDAAEAADLVWASVMTHWGEKMSWLFLLGACVSKKV